MYESVKRDHYITLYTIYGMLEGFNGLIATFYFMFVSKNFQGLFFMAYTWLTLSLVAVFFYPESPRYLIKSGQIDEASDSFNYMARFNSYAEVSEPHIEQLFGDFRAKEKTPMKSRYGDSANKSSAYKSRNGDTDEKSRLLKNDEEDAISKMSERTRLRKIRNNMMYFLNQPIILKNLIALTIIWIVCGFNYYLCNLMVKYFPGNFQYNMMVMFTADIVAAAFAGTFVSYIEPRKLFFTYTLMSAMAGICMIFLIDKENPNWTVPVIVGFARLGVNCSFVTLYMTHSRYFPTLFAVTSMGIANIITRFFVVFAPLAAELDFPTPMIIFTLMQFAGFVSSFFINDDVHFANQTEYQTEKLD